MPPIALFNDVTALKRKPRSEEALQLLKRMAAQVEPIMKKRGWKVQLLKEMYPKNPNLLGLNYGKTRWIAIRLRQPYNDTHFISYTSLLDTLLHDQHNKNFHDLWKELEVECESLMLQGRTGLGFLGHGRKLGSTPNNPYSISKPRIPDSVVGSSNSKFPGKGYKLGTNIKLPIKLGSQPSPTILDYLRRSAITANQPQSLRSSQALSWCGDSKKNIIPSSENNDVIIISDDDSDSNDNSFPTENLDSWVCSKCSCRNPSLFLQCLACIELRSSVKPEASEQWACEVCTLLNTREFSLCQACDTPKREKPDPDIPTSSKKPCI